MQNISFWGTLFNSQQALSLSFSALKVQNRNRNQASGQNCSPPGGYPVVMATPAEGVPEEPGRPPTSLESTCMELEFPSQRGLGKPRPLAFTYV